MVQYPASRLMMPGASANRLGERFIGMDSGISRGG